MAAPDAESYLAIAPTDDNKSRNSVHASLEPIAVWELADSHFAFDSSLLLPSMTEELLHLIALIRGNPDAPITIFGHADPTGEDGYNKLLSGRRAKALYALLTRRVSDWEYLAQNPMGRDDWHRDGQAGQVMRSTVETAKVGPVTPLGADLMGRYMDALGVDGDGRPFTLPRSAFLGRGEDGLGRADYQGCGEFNPRVVFSEAEAKTFAAPGQKAARDEANGPNRRVTVFLFKPGTTVGSRWPCPRAGDGVSGCRKRFWSDGEQRRLPQAARRERPAADTFACRFYQRLLDAIPPKEVVRMYGCKYRGVVVDNQDPENRGRVRIQVAEVAGVETLWAMPCVPFAGPQVGFIAPPPIGASVWAEFEKGDPNLPIWSGCFWGPNEMPAVAIEAASGGMVFRVEGASVVISSATSPPSITIETDLGVKVALGGQVTVTAGSASVVVTDGQVSINDGALTVA